MATQQQLDTQAGIADLRVKYEHLKKIITIKNTFQKQQNFLLFNKSDKQDELNNAQSIEEYAKKTRESDSFLTNGIIENDGYFYKDYFNLIINAGKTPKNTNTDDIYYYYKTYPTNGLDRRNNCEIQLKDLEDKIKNSPIYLKEMTDAEMDAVIEKGTDSMVHAVAGVSDADATEIAQAYKPIAPSKQEINAKIDQIENITDLRPKAEHLEKILIIQNTFQEQQNFLLFNNLKNKIQNSQDIEAFNQNKLELQSFNLKQGITYEKYTNDKTNPFQIKDYFYFKGSYFYDKEHYVYQPDGETRRQAAEKYIASLENRVQSSPVYVKNMTDTELDTVISKGTNSMVHAVLGVSDEDANQIAQATKPTMLSPEQIETSRAKLDQLEGLTDLRGKYEHLNKIITIQNAFTDQQNILISNKYHYSYAGLNGITKRFDNPFGFSRPKKDEHDVAEYATQLPQNKTRYQIAENYIQYLEKAIHDSPVFLKNMTDSEMDNVIKQGTKSMVHAVAGISDQDANEIANAKRSKSSSWDKEDLDKEYGITDLNLEYNHLNKIITIQNNFARQQNFLLFHKLEDEIKNTSDSNIRNQKLIEKQNFNFKSGCIQVESTLNPFNVYEYESKSYSNVGTAWNVQTKEFIHKHTAYKNKFGEQTRREAAEYYIQDLEKAIHDSPIFVKNMTDEEMDTVILGRTESMVHAIAGLSYEDANSIASATPPKEYIAPIYASVL